MFTVVPVVQLANELKSDMLKDRTPVVMSAETSATSYFEYIATVPNNILGGRIDVTPIGVGVMYAVGPKVPRGKDA